MYQSILATELKQKLADSTLNLVLLDVRQPDEHDFEHIPNSILIPLNELPERYEELLPYQNNEIVVYCKAGVRSAMACQFLAAKQFNKLINLADGIIGWNII